MASISFQAIKGKKGQESILVRLTHKSELQIRAATGIKIPLGAFNKKKQLVKPQFDNGENAILSNLKVFLNGKLKKVVDYSTLDKDWLKQAIFEYFNPNIDKNSRISKDITLFEYIRDFIKQAEHAINPKTGKPLNRIVIRDYFKTYELLKEFSRSQKNRLDFEDIDLEFYNEFVAFLQNKQFAANTVGKFIKNLKVFLNKATEEGINTNMAYKSHRFVKIQVETENIALSEDELKQLEDLDLSTNHI